MLQCAIVLNGDDVVKVTNYPRKYNKLNNNPKVKILEECNPENVEERYTYWKQTYIPVPKKKEPDTFEYDLSEPRVTILKNPWRIIFGYGEKNMLDILRYINIQNEQFAYYSNNIEEGKRLFEEWSRVI